MLAEHRVEGTSWAGGQLPYQLWDWGGKLYILPAVNIY